MGGGGLDSGSDRSSPVDTLDDLSNPASEAGAGAAKRPRNPSTQLTEEHKDALSLAFALDPFPSPATLEFLAGELGGGGGLEAKVVGQWFQNHRLRLKQLHGGEAVEHLLAGSQGTTFDPAKFRFLLTHRRMEMAATAAAAAGGGGGSASPAVFAGFPAFFSNFGPAAAAAAAAAMFGLPPVRGGVPAPSHGFEAAGGGLDLRFSRGEGESSVAASAEMESISGEMSDGGSDRKEEGEGGHRSPAEQQLQRSRRKPALPQWVNPDWPTVSETGERSENLAAAAADADQPINGVCVRNMAAYGDEDEEREEAGGRDSETDAS